MMSRSRRYCRRYELPRVFEFYGVWSVLMVLQNTLTMAVLSAYQWDTTWIMDKLNLRGTGLILVMQATEGEEVFVMATSVMEAISNSILATERTAEENVLGVKWCHFGLPGHVWADQLHAFQADATFPRELPTDSSSNSQPRKVRLGWA